MPKQKPKMILFDYGQTLAHEPTFDSCAGNAALLRYATHNPNNLTAEQAGIFADRLWGESGITKARALDVEIHSDMFDRLLYETLQIGFSISPPEMERVFWDAAAPGEMMVNVDKLLDYLWTHNIRTGVISNISFSGQGLKDRINHLFPHNHFEFIIASSEYIVRKPNPLIFELALRKANLAAENVWFCGDNIAVDILGANQVGMFPVWYHSPLPCDYRDKKLDVPPECDHLYIRDWLELIDTLEELP